MNYSYVILIYFIFLGYSYLIDINIKKLNLIYLKMKMIVLY